MIEELVCQWKTATELVGSHKHDADASDTSNDCLLALMKVNPAQLAQSLLR